MDDCHWYCTHSPWDDLCSQEGCGHRMGDHVLDWDLDLEIDCSHPGCACPEYRPPRRHI